MIIDGRPVGVEVAPYVIAEMSGNHDGELATAMKIVDAVAASGAHALKLQTYRADTITIDADGPEFRVSRGHDLWGGERLYDLYERAHTPWEWHGPIFERARSMGLTVFSSPFDPTAVDLLESLGAPAYKIASSEIVDLPLIRRVARTGKPLIISTGMASLGEMDAAVQAARGAGCGHLVLLGCTAAYPAAVSDSNLRRLPALAEAFGVPVGLSDHTPGIGAAVAAVALGACVIEKHVTLDRAGGGVDAAFSLEPDELSALVVESDRAWQALGSAVVRPVSAESEGMRFRRSLYVVADVRAGDVVSESNVRSIRPAGGLPPDAITTVAGRTFRRDAVRGTPLTWDLI
ncbi:N-acetylneuraminate synthase [Streptosporangium album]|uniref:N-acetylneuraminate synthase n=1 Tax=Streptosporangium album TaxID=47479 RepID=A0A7W7RX60_9ACTN|nr:pseudaminic acid synthase [Streptosporangium album]MBB4939692.1 N-acetylneuraminate synthase [Streptosporangium album]